MKKPRITNNRVAQAEAAEQVFLTRYHDCQYRFVEFFVDHITDVNRAFGNELQKAMLLAVVGQMRIRAVLSAQSQGDGSGSSRPSEYRISASRLADVTGVPRQTVRRKMEELRRLGWVIQTPDGAWMIAMKDGAAPARQSLSELDRRGIARIARLYAGLDALVQGESP